MSHTTLCFVGDISLNGNYSDLVIRKGPIFPFERIQPELDSGDIVMGNLESPLVLSGEAPQFPMKTPLSADVRYVEGLKWAGFDIFNLSNNHILDYGEAGVVSTQHALERRSIAYFGYGEDLRSARQMTVLPANSLAVGFVGYTDVVIDSPFYASTDTSGVARFHIETAREQIPKYKKSVDLLVVNLHWGIEYFHLPTPQQIATARELIDLGADIIIGHHPHTLQGIEKYNGGIVAYSLGNFVFADIRWDWMTQQNERRTTYYTLSRNLRESVILRVNVGRNRELDYHLAGTYVAKSGQILPSRRRPVRRMQELSTCLGREDYPSYFENALRRFNRTTLIKRSLARLKRFYKLRPKHLREFGDLIRKST